MSDSVRPHRWQPTRLPRPWDSPDKNIGVGCHFLLQCMKVKSESKVAQSYPTLRDCMDWSPPGTSVHGIFQARVLEWDAIAFSKASYWGYSNQGDVFTCLSSGQLRLSLAQSIFLSLSSLLSALFLFLYLLFIFSLFPFCHLTWIIFSMSDFPFAFHFHSLEKKMAAHSCVLAWRIPGMGEPGALPPWGHTESDTIEAT